MGVLELYLLFDKYIFEEGFIFLREKKEFL